MLQLYEFHKNRYSMQLKASFNTMMQNNEIDLSLQIS